VAIVALGLFIGEQTNSGYLVAALWICLFGPSITGGLSALAGLIGLLALLQLKQEAPATETA
jgi:hypothetical protein